MIPLKALTLLSLQVLKGAEDVSSAPFILNLRVPMDTADLTVVWSRSITSKEVRCAQVFDMAQLLIFIQIKKDS